MAAYNTKIKKLTNEVLAVTMEIRDKYPELYQYLAETPFVTSTNNKGVDYTSMEEYLNTIRSQLKDYNEGRKVYKLSPRLK